jgi:hypothetical protein
MGEDGLSEEEFRDWREIYDRHNDWFFRAL